MSSSYLKAASAHGARSNDKPMHRRFFIGPMSEKVLSQSEAQVRKKKKRIWFHSSRAPPNGDEVDHDSLSSIIQEHAFQFFISQGGNEEDWGDHEAESIRQEMLRRWGDSEWGNIWKRRMQKSHEPTSRWVGGSFEVGNFLGVNILDEAHPVGSRHSTSSKQPSSFIRPGSSTRANSSATHNLSTTRTQPAALTSSATENSVTKAPSELLPPKSYNSSPLRSAASAPGLSAFSPPPENAHDVGSRRPASDMSTTPLLISDTDQASPRKAHLNVSQRPFESSMTIPSCHDTDANLGISTSGSGMSALETQKRKSVHYTDSHVPAPPSVPPTEVLARTGSDVQESSAGATEAAATQDEITWGDVVMRDRMLVRVSYTKSEGLGNYFDEKQNRTTCHMRYEDWDEFMVVWRQNRIEIYENYTLPGKEWMVGHKHLAFIIPLNIKTKLSLYSFVDLTFCLTCPPTPVHSSESKARAIFHRSNEGTNIFVFKLKSRSRALDWTWQLWRQSGGELPPYIEIHCPAMDSRVKVDIPDSLSLEPDQGVSMFTRQNMIGLCRKSLKNYRDWEFIIERELEKGKHLELAWRMEMKLDWIWLDNDVDGKKREWAVLCGLALKQSGKSAHLEIRLGDHVPSILRLQDGRQLHEPPAIEGYLDRIKPNTQIKEQVYLATHDGNIFSLTPAHAQPPSPPGLHPALSDTGDLTLRQTEVRRGTHQVMHATGVCDLRSIIAIRRAFHMVPQDSHSTENVRGGQKNSGAQDGDDEWLGTWAVERTDSDNEDEGGDLGLTKTADKPKLRMQRSFELLLKTGQIVRFEAHSRRVTLEWIERLRDLIIYWKHRHRVDAREEMDLAQVGSHRPRLTPQLHVRCGEEERPPDAPADMEASLPALGSLYNWCVLDGCKAVLKSGKLYTRKGLHGHYKLVQLFLTSGHLIQYHITPKSPLHHREHQNVNLLDAYVASGYFAALTLPKGQFSPTESSVPRRYHDGLEADDPDEDMLFMIWYRSQAPVVDKAATTIGNGIDTGAQDKIPRLSAKRKLMVFRTRSKLERDAWCWAINCEIDKLVRAGREREERLRKTGGLINL